MGFGDWLNPFSKPDLGWSYDYYSPENNAFYSKNSAFRDALAQRAAQGGLGIAGLQGAQAQSNLAQQAAAMRASGERGGGGAMAAALAARAYGQDAQNQAMDTAAARAKEAQQARQAMIGYLSDADRARLARAAIRNADRRAAMQLNARRQGWEYDALQQKAGAVTGSLGAMGSSLASYGFGQGG